MSAIDNDLHKFVRTRMTFERLDLQVSAIWSKAHPEFYVVLGFGFPTFMYAMPADRWFSAPNDMLNPRVWRQLQPRVENIEHISAADMLDIYHRGLAGLVKWRILK